MIKRSKKIEKSEHSYESSLGSIEYLLVRSNQRRTSSIYIDEKAKVSIYVPHKVTQKYIESFINEKINWIFKCIDHAKKNQAIISSKKFEEGGEFLFLGKKFPLDVQSKECKRVAIKFEGVKWIVTVPKNMDRDIREAKIKEKLVQWYRTQAEEIVGGRIFHYSRVLGVNPKVIAVRTQKRMWGCCDYNKQQIHINWQVILSPLKVIDYVVIHELCHLVHPNHSKRFWNMVERYMPDYKVYKKWLTQNHAEMTLP